MWIACERDKKTGSHGGRCVFNTPMCVWIHDDPADDAPSLCIMEWSRGSGEILIEHGADVKDLFVDNDGSQVCVGSFGTDTLVTCKVMTTIRLTLFLKRIKMSIHDNSVQDAASNCVSRRSRGSGEDPCRTWCRCY